jgi:hypothetical protein
MTLEFISLLLDIEVLFDSDQPDISLEQRVDQGDHFRGAAAESAQLSDNQGIGFVKELQKFIDPALLTGFARRDRLIYHNSAILSRLLDKYQASKNAKALALLKRIFPTVWQLSMIQKTRRADL